MRVYSQKYGRNGLGIATATIHRLTDYHGPGNIRELDHAVERAVILCDQDELQAEDFYFAPTDRQAKGAGNNDVLENDLTLN